MADHQETSTGSDSPTSGNVPVHPRRRWRWLALIALSAVVFHVPLLRSVGRVLTVDEPVGEFDTVVILGGDHRLEVAKQFLDADQVHSIWMIEGRPDYLVTEEILPSPSEVVRTELTAAGISPERITLLRAEDAVDLADFARAVAMRLQQAPETRVLLVCGAFQGRHVQIVFDDVLEKEFRSQVSILGLPDDDFDVDGWWRSRSGLKEFFGQVCQIGFTLVAGTDRREHQDMVDPDGIERTVKQRFGGAACYAD